MLRSCCAKYRRGEIPESTGSEAEKNYFVLRQEEGFAVAPEKEREGT